MYLKFCKCRNVSQFWELTHVHMIHVVTNTHYFPELFNRVMTLDWFYNYFYAMYILWNNWWIWSDRIDTLIFLCQNMCNNKNKQSGRVSCSACNAFILFVRDCLEQSCGHLLGKSCSVCDCLEQSCSHLLGKSCSVRDCLEQSYGHLLGKSCSVRDCLEQSCGHLLGKSCSLGFPLVLLNTWFPPWRFWSFPVWRLGQGVKFVCKPDYCLFYLHVF